ncbi:uncharacterized protein G2W53_008165 [Senna tora]|uniref:Uncharacterized protein n=1 Tax=Senna tora TaxID=362788 RepID=A0A834X9K9_9FABA|nr:uncharacterized protein G2W53_008165 [Senna tora]
METMVYTGAQGVVSMSEVKGKDSVAYVCWLLREGLL